MTVRLAVDIGGTFTDVVLRTPRGDYAHKLLTTYSDPAQAVIVGVEHVLAEGGCAAADVEIVLHGTTLATNALIERRGAKTALITTAGHRDALEMALENRFEQYDVNIDRPRPLVPRQLRLPVTERMDAQGHPLRALDDGDVDKAIDTLLTNRVESVAVGLLHSYRNPTHERQVADRVSARAPHIALTLSSDVCPEIREYERLSTACANAYVKPLMAGYLNALAEQLAELGVTCPVRLMTSGGGLTSLTTAARYPIRLVESGPAGGAILAAQLAAAHETERLLAFDMGGTTAKLCLIDDAQPQLSRSFEVDRAYRFKKGSGLPVRIPVIEMVEIGAGGGSIASVDALQRLRVGPSSAGSEPGPAAYDRGGQSPTVTDADVVLGLLTPERFAGGRLSLSEPLASRALQDHVAAATGTNVIEAAIAVNAVVAENMAAAARAHAAEWGKSVEERTLVAFGGAAPLHAAELAQRLKISRVVVPPGAGVGSALGFLLAPISFEVVRSRYLTLDDYAPDLAKSLFDEMQAEALAVVREATDAPLSVARRIYMRYVGQGYEVAVTLADNEIPDAVALRRAFELAYVALYGRTIPDQAIELLSWTLGLSAPAPVSTRFDPPSKRRPVGVERTTPIQAANGEVQQAALLLRDTLHPGDTCAGPALILESHTTTFVPSEFDLLVLADGSLELTLSAVEEP